MDIYIYMRAEVYVFAHSVPAAERACVCVDAACIRVSGGVAAPPQPSSSSWSW